MKNLCNGIIECKIIKDKELEGFSNILKVNATL